MRLILMLALSSLLFVSVGCKKSIDQSNTFDTQTKRDETTVVQNWLTERLSVVRDKYRSSLMRLQSNIDFSGLQVVQLKQSKKMIILPLAAAYVDSMQGRSDLENTLVLIADLQDSILQANIIEHTFDTDRRPLYEVLKTIYHGKAFRGNDKLIFLDIYGRKSFGWNYANGTAHQQYRLQTDNPIQGSSIAARTCTHYYWVTYLDGEPISAEYLYTICEGSGSDDEELEPVGDGGTTVEDCSNEWATIQGSAASENDHIVRLGTSGNSRTNQYFWVIYKQNWGLWKVISGETGVHKFTNNEWQWESLTHIPSSVVVNGWVIGGNITPSIISSTPAVGLYYAGMQLTYHLSLTALCQGFPLQFNGTMLSSSPIWNVND